MVRLRIHAAQGRIQGGGLRVNGAHGVLAIDPGHATGWSTWYCDDETPMTRTGYGVVAGGPLAVSQWMQRNQLLLPTELVVEEWRLAGDAKNPDLTGKEVIGAIRAMAWVLGWPVPQIQHRSQKVHVHDDVLRRENLWVAPGSVEWVDGRDVNDSAIHALTWAKLQGHGPTIARFWPPR